MFDFHVVFGVELHLQHGLFRAAGPEVDHVDRVSAGMDAHQADADLDGVIAAGFVLDDAKGLEGELLGFSMRVPVGARRRTVNWPVSTMGNISRPRVGSRK